MVDGKYKAPEMSHVYSNVSVFGRESDTESLMSHMEGTLEGMDVIEKRSPANPGHICASILGKSHRACSFSRLTEDR